MGIPHKIENFSPTLESQKDAQKFLERIISGKTKVPDSVKDMIIEALYRYSEGEAVIISSIDENFTTQEAADFLQISRKHLIKILDEGKIPYFKVGTHRRIKRIGVLSYKKSLNARRLKYLEKMTAISEKAEHENE